MTIPDKWLIVQFPACRKVFGTWSGGYLDGDSWKMNSGIESIDELEDSYNIHGFSGSIYQCHKKFYGTTSYGAGLLHSWVEDDDIPMSILTEEEFLTIYIDGSKNGKYD